MIVKITYHKNGSDDMISTMTSKELFQDFCLIAMNMGFIIDSIQAIDNEVKPVQA